jgi:ubiquinone/menaquinone biosynthesis C-methylase UbiE
MLSVAARKHPQISFRIAPAESLPFPDATFHAVTCQFALMFFEDRTAALREMFRVLRPEGKMAVAVWGQLESSPGYFAMVELLESMFGGDVGAGLRSPFSLGAESVLRSVFAEAGLVIEQFETITGRAVFPSIESWVHTDIRGWTMSEAIDDAAFARLVKAAEVALARFALADGHVEFAAPAHIVTVRKTGS